MKFLKNHPAMVKYLISGAIVVLLLSAGILALREYGSPPSPEATPTPVAVGVSRDDEKKGPPGEVFLADLAKLIREGQVVALDIWPDRVVGTMTSGGEVVCHLPSGAGYHAVPLLKDLGVEAEWFDFENPQRVAICYHSSREWLSLAIVAVFLLGVGIVWSLMRCRSGDGIHLGFGKSRAREVGADGEPPGVTFDDVAGCDKAKEELREVIEFLREPEKFRALGIRVPNVLLVGPPGCGKTLMAKAVSGEAGVPFFAISGSEFVEMFVGVGAKRVRELFDKAKRSAPAIIFIDEVDGVGGARTGAYAGENKEYQQTLNQILTEMDGFGTDTRVVIIAATNRPDMLDPALLRPGRFDRRVVVNRPDITGREAILKVHVRDKPLAEDVDLVDLARRTPGFVGADLANLVNEAAILAARRDKAAIGMREFLDAMARVIAGAERKVLMTEEEKRAIAYHEAGHALVMHALPGCDTVRWVSIIPRGMSLGHTFATPDKDRWGMTKVQLCDQIAGLLGGRVAEELVFGVDNVGTGAANDLERATRIAREMVTRFGMGSHLRVSTQAVDNHLGPGYVAAELSADDAAEVEQVLREAYELTLALLQESRGILDRLVEVLLEKETIDREEFLAIVDGS